MTFCTTTEPSKPALLAICLIGSSMAFLIRLRPTCSSPSGYIIKNLLCAKECNAATRNNTFFNSSPCSVKGILNPCLFLLHFSLCCSPNTDHCNTADKLCKAFLEFFTVIIACGFFNLGPYLFYPAFKLFLASTAINYCGVILVNGYFFGSTKIGNGNIFQLMAQIFAYNLTACQYCYIFKHGLSSVAKPWCLYSSAFECTAQLVYNECCKGLAFNILCNNQKGAS